MIRSLICFLICLSVFFIIGCDDFSDDPGGLLGPGNWKLTTGFEGLDRDFYVHVPEGYTGTEAVPLLFNFHGYSESVSAQYKRDGFVDKSDEEGFVLVYLQGYGTPGFQGFNAGEACCPPANSKGLDDVGLVVSLVDIVSARCNIDLSRVYAHGHSNGAGLAHRLAREAAHVFAAVSPKSMPVLVPDAVPSQPVPVIHFHGTSDLTINYNGGSLFFTEFLSVRESFENWAAVNSCSGSPVVTYSNGDGECESYQACGSGAEVSLCTVSGGDHILYDNGSIDIADVAWGFMAGFSLP
ncbi:MAG: hypothetical protein GY754_37010 [bacterium]|nr:hypothetical protein [bacterium]